MPPLPVDLTIREALDLARAQGLERVDAHLTLGHLLQRQRAWLLAHDDERLGAQQSDRWRDWLARRVAGEPLAYILGEKEFFGLHLRVSPQVLVPRPDTETLVDWALDIVRELRTQRPHPDAPLSVVDLGTGSGAIALALAAHGGPLQVTATDASEGALNTVLANAQALGLTVRCVAGHWLSPLAGERFDLIVSNPPYIAEGDPHLAALTHEPISALTAGADGLADLRTLCRQAPDHLHPGGWLVLEHGWDQAAPVAQLMHDAGLTAVGHRRDLGGVLRCTAGKLPET
ncbi:MAG: peptide chain release factor N(5)-glutamine methyltransferase [Pseudomonadota bacterium]|jgi:release factor glutamine methyltransferase